MINFSIRQKNLLSDSLISTYEIHYEFCFEFSTCIENVKGFYRTIFVAVYVNLIYKYLLLLAFHFLKFKIPVSRYFKVNRNTRKQLFTKCLNAIFLFMSRHWEQSWLCRRRRQWLLSKQFLIDRQTQKDRVWQRQRDKLRHRKRGTRDM